MVRGSLSSPFLTASDESSQTTARARTSLVAGIPRGSLVIGGAVGVCIFWLAFDNGSYDPVHRSGVAIAVWWALVLGTGLGLFALGRLSRTAAAIACSLAAWALWSLFSAVWAPAIAPSVADFNRLMLYLGLFLLVCVAVQGRAVPYCADGLGLGLAAVGVLALASRLFPTLNSRSGELTVLQLGSGRLSYPVGYWNALAVLTAIGLPLLLRTVLLAETRWLRWPAAAAAPAMVTVIYLTSSRTGVLAAAIGLAFLFVFSERPVVTLLMIVVVGLFSGVAVGVIRHWPILVDGATNGGAVSDAGRRAGPLLLGVALMCAAALELARRIARSRALGRRADRLALVAVGIAGLLAIVLINPVKQFEDFKRTPTEVQQVNNHLLEGTGNGRWQLWSSALDQFRAHPLIGGGTGSFEPWWNRHRGYPLFVQDAHSLYIGALGELGLVGLLLLIAFAAALVAAFVAARRGAVGPARTTAAALGGTVAGLMVGAGTDWVWYVPAVGAVGLMAAALLTRMPSGPSVNLFSRRTVRVLAVSGVAVFGLAIIVLQGLPMLETLKIRSSQAAARQNDTDAAARDARAARRLAPWDSMPYLQLALVEERRGNLASARQSVVGAIKRDSADWRLWLIRSRLEAKLGDISAARHSLARVRELNPLAADRL